MAAKTPSPATRAVTSKTAEVPLNVLTAIPTPPSPSPWGRRTPQPHHLFTDDPLAIAKTRYRAECEAAVRTLEDGQEPRKLSQVSGRFYSMHVNLFKYMPNRLSSSSRFHHPFNRLAL